MRISNNVSALAVLALVGACSVINSPGDVVPQSDSNGGSSTGAKAGSMSQPEAGDTSMGGQGEMAGSGGTTGPEAGAAGEPNIDQDPGPGLNPTTPLFVVGQVDDKNMRSLSVLNGRTGKQIVTEPLPVAAIAYDEAPGRHVWFVFTSGSYPAKPDGTADLEVRRFVDATNKWYVVARATALPPPVPDELVVLNQRLAYLSHRVVSGKTVDALTVLDTSDLKNVSEVTSRTAADGESYVGLVGDRGSDVNATAEGGRLRLMIGNGCTTDCNLAAQEIFVAAKLTDGSAINLDRFIGTPRFIRSRTDNRLVIAYRSTKPSLRTLVRSYATNDLTNPTQTQIDMFGGDDVGGIALAECADAAAVSDVTGHQLFAVQLVSGNLQSADLVDPGGPLYGEPFGPSVIALNPKQAPGLRAFEIARSGATNLAINPRSVWVPNSTIKPLTAAVRRAETLKCP